LKHEGQLNLDDALLLTIGRHFRIDGAKIVVGRNGDENYRLQTIAKRRQIPCLMVKDYKGPVTLIMGKEDPVLIEKSAAITVRYSDAPKNTPINVICKFTDKESEITVTAMSDEQIERLRV
jgi:predicted ribosome quality control (RQC) complex YloA/Tae2 family protein